MTQYISSFLIDPVVRQARRFSRSGNEPPNSEIRARPSYTRHEGETPHHSSSAAAGALNEVPLPVGISIDDLPGSVVTDGPEVLSPVALGEHRDLQQWTSIHEASSAASSLGTETLDSEANDRRQVSTTVETWNNPLSRVHGDPRSLSSSMSSLHQSMTEANMSSADPSVQPARRNTHHSRGRGDSQGSTAGNAALPADDGMSFMRRRIIAIQRTTSSNEEKARLVHGVMTEKHNASQQSLHASHVARAQSPCSMHSSERPFTPSSPKSMDSMRRTISPPTSSSSNADPANRFYLSPDDLRPTYYQKPTLDSKGEEREVSSMEVEDALKALGCAHYKRNIKLQCSACHRWYTCRFCHDEVEDHMLNRRETKSMLCMLCGCAQPASEECATCNERAAWYYCDVCKLWDDDSEKSIYHCNDCGICRIGEGLGKDFFHCKKCCVCMSIAIRDTHRCIERSTDCDCPICGEYMFTSPQTVVFMKCGHSIHHRCYKEHMKTSYRCPICSKSIVNMEWQFTHLRRAIESQPMPPEFQDTKAWVYCNDCNAKSTVKYHWLGLECGHCNSYNTAQLQLLSGVDASQETSDTAAPTIDTEDVTQISRPNSRGRSRLTASHVGRSATSAPPLAAMQGLLQRGSWPEVRTRNARSLAPGTPLYSPLDLSDNGSDAEDSMDNDEEGSDVDFWGGESPRIRVASPRPNCDMAIDGSSEEEEDEDDSEDEDMSDDDVEEDEAGDYNRMEIFGHR